MSGDRAELPRRDVRTRARHRCSGFPSTNASEANAPFYVGDGMGYGNPDLNNDAWQGNSSRAERFRKPLDWISGGFGACLNPLPFLCNEPKNALDTQRSRRHSLGCQRFRGDMSTATLSPPARAQRGVSQAAPLIGTIAPPDRYCLYARKSSEDDERQALSIESQVKEMMAIAKREGLEIVEVRRESHSAKASGCRPVYMELLKDVREGAFNGILTWAPDRLSRNAGDLGTLVDLMDQGLLKEIRTHGQRFTNNPNEKFLLMILCSQAKLENDNRGINTKRGMKSRAETGYRPCKPPLGYLTMRAPGASKSHLIIDSQRAPLVRKMFEMVAEEGAHGRALHRWMQEVGFRTRLGKVIPLCMVYKILHNEFYTGRFEYPVGGGQWFKGDYEPLVTKKLFDDVQRILAETPKKPWGVKDFAFVKLMTCGNCGSGVTAEEKHKHLKDGSVKRYVYYRCTHARDRDCKDGSIREDHLIAQLAEMIDKVNLDASGIKKRIQAEYEHLQRFSTGVLGMTGEKAMPKVDMKKYALFVLRNGRSEEKRELLGCIRSKIFLASGSVTMHPENDEERDISCK